MKETMPAWNIQTVGIIGYGEFGRFMKKLCQELFPNVRVKISSRSHDNDQQTFFSFEEVCSCDVVVPAVPIHVFEETLIRARDLLSPQSIILDITTVKEYTTALLQKHARGLNYLSTHPMFGPYSYEKKGNSLSGLRLVVCDHSLPQGMYAAFSSRATQAGLVVLELTPQEHDRLLAETLFLTHFVAQVIVEGDFRRTEIDTVSFGFLMDAIESVKHDTNLFKDVYRYNHYCRSVLDRFEEATHEVKERLREAVSTGERETIVRG